MKKKHEVRTYILQRRDAIPPEVRARKSRDICRHLELIVKKHAKHPSCVSVFAAMRSEVDVAAFVQAAGKHGWGICFPCMVRETPDTAARMAFFRVEPERMDQARVTFLNNPLRTLPRAALVAAGYKEVAPGDIDVAVVPLVAFDDAGNRLGYGGGNYDRFLPALRGDALIVGVAFAEQRVDRIPCEAHDQPLAHIISA